MRFILLGIVLSINLCISDSATAQTSPELDLRDFCPSSQDCPIRELNGSWGFIKGKLHTAEELLARTDVSTLKVPGTWSRAPLNPWHADWGAARDVGTYWLILRNVQARNGLALEINNVHSSYRLFWQPLNALQKNSELFRLGWNDRDPMHSIASLRKDFVVLPLESEVADYILVIQVANPNVAKGGLRTAPRIGMNQQFHRELMVKSIVFSLLIGSMLIIAVYHFLIYMQRKADRSALWLAIQCLSIAAHTVAMQGILDFILPEPSDARVLLRTWMMYLPHILAPIAFYAFLTVNFPKVHHRWAKYLFSFPTLLLSGLLLAPLSFVSRLYLVLFVPTMIVFIAFIFWRCLVSIRGDREFQWVASGITFLGFASINDALAGPSQTGGVSVLPYAEVVFIMIQGGLLSKRFAKAFKTTQILSKSLQNEAESKRIMASKAAHHLNNSFHVINGSIDDVESTLSRLQDRFAALLPPEETWDTPTKLVTHSFNEDFGRIKQCSDNAMIALKRAQQASDGLRFLSGVHGNAMNYHQIGLVWQIFVKHYVERSGDFQSRISWQELEEDDWSTIPILLSIDVFCYALTDLVANISMELGCPISVGLVKLSEGQKEIGCMLQFSSLIPLAIREERIHEVRFAQIVALTFYCSLDLAFSQDKAIFLGIALKFKTRGFHVESAV